MAHLIHHLLATKLIIRMRDKYLRAERLLSLPSRVKSQKLGTVTMGVRLWVLRGEAPGVVLMINFFMVKITKATTNEQVNSWNLARDTLGFLQYGGEGSRT